MDEPRTAAAASRLAWSPALDGLRAIAVLLVMFFHFGRAAWVPGGWLGVDVFFVLSGFLITTLLLREWQATRTISLKDFYVRRMLRLLPAFGAFLAIYLLLLLTFPETWLQPGQDIADAFLQTLFAITYLQNWLIAAGVEPTHSFGHIWSLAIEMQFYLVWPPLLLAMLHAGMSRRAIFAVTASLAAISATAMLWSNDPSWQLMYYGTQFRAHQLLIGALAAQLLAANVITPSIVRTRAYMALLATATLSITLLTLVANEHWTLMFLGGCQLVAVAAATVILHLTLAPDTSFTRVFAWRPLVYLGRRSYAMYLWHLPVGYSLRGLDLVPEALLATAITVVLAEISFRLVERPALRLKDSLSKQHESLAQTAASPAAAA